MTRMTMRRAGIGLACLALAAVLAGASGGEALAQQPDWRARERRCMQGCPSFPRYQGSETDAEYWARMRAQAAHDACKMQCARQSAASFPKSFVPISRSAADYYRRNAE